ncbi:hypothetical protein EGR_03055 [Echinococcus granulosus]|uniref:Uncharacterized protein n=1 Tax=Echinococcus granulosus TaxID=6210 RepID=W6V6L4_ECHGR|nr:hypothetical protein EGR_03055 [Echinococcus granulosus]EUB62034.1 hypothetical protein EGR_03055 [Echinococcus granulosus]
METPTTTNIYPEMSPPLLETVMRLTIDKVKTQRSPTAVPVASQPQTPRPSSGGGEQSQRLVPFARSKSTSLLRTLLIIQIGRKTSRLLSLISQPDLSQSVKPIQQVPSAPLQPPPAEEPQPRCTHGGKRRSSEDENIQTEGSAVPLRERPNSLEGPSLEKAPCLEKINRTYSVSCTSGEISPVRGLNQLSLQASTNTTVSYGEDSCPRCQRCSMWMQQQQQLRPNTSKFQLCLSSKYAVRVNQPTPYEGSSIDRYRHDGAKNRYWEVCWSNASSVDQLIITGRSITWKCTSDFELGYLVLEDEEEEEEEEEEKKECDSFGSGDVETTAVLMRRA